MQTTSFKVSDNLYIVSQQIGKTEPEAVVATVTPVDHIVVVDCSGSMSSDLPKLREHLKKKLSKLIRDDDTLSIIWFSGKGQFGTLVESEPVTTLVDLTEVQRSIDRWLKPIGMTGFKEPLESIPALVEKIRKKRPNAVASMVFMSDGYDNQSNRADILKVVEKISGCVSSSTFVEYGYYADRQLLSAMAEKACGINIFSEDFDKYQPMFEAAMQKKISGAPRTEIDINGDVIGGFAFSFADGDITTYGLSANKALVSGGVSNIFYLSPVAVGNLYPATLQDIARDRCMTEQSKLIAGNTRNDALNAGYASVALFSQRMKSDIVFSLLRALGDVQFIEQFGLCFGKQRYSDFTDKAQKAVFSSDLRFQNGFDPNKVPKDDAFTVLDLFRILSEDDNNRVLMEHPAFKYSRIGRGRLDVSDNLTQDEFDEIQKLTASMASERDPMKIRDITTRIASITDKKTQALKFVADPAPNGYPVSSLTFNEDRPNISILVKKPGTVDISSRIPENLIGKLPNNINTFIWRNYAMVKDGLVNVDFLPCKISKATAIRLVEAGILYNAYDGSLTSSEPLTEVVFSLRELPVINRKMVKSTSARWFFEKAYELKRAQAAQKVYNAFAKELLTSKKSDNLSATYDENAATWLKEQGITDGGFNPKTVQAPSTDFYLGKELKVSLKGLSNLPSIKELKAQIDKGKLNAGGTIMKPVYDRVNNFLSSDIYNESADKQRVLEAWLDSQTKAQKNSVRDLIYEISQTTFTLIVGNSWFSEFNSLDENSMTIEVDGQKIEAKAEFLDIECKI